MGKYYAGLFKQTVKSFIVSCVFYPFVVVHHHKANSLAQQLVQRAGNLDEDLSSTSCIVNGYQK